MEWLRRSHDRRWLSRGQRQLRAAAAERIQPTVIRGRHLTLARSYSEAGCVQTVEMKMPGFCRRRRRTSCCALTDNQPRRAIRPTAGRPEVPGGLYGRILTDPGCDQRQTRHAVPHRRDAATGMPGMRCHGFPFKSQRRGQRHGLNFASASTSPIARFRRGRAQIVIQRHSSPSLFDAGVPNREMRALLDSNIRFSRGSPATVVRQDIADCFWLTSQVRQMLHPLSLEEIGKQRDEQFAGDSRRSFSRTTCGRQRAHRPGSSAVGASDRTEKDRNDTLLSTNSARIGST